MDGTDQSGYTISDLVCYDQESASCAGRWKGKAWPPAPPA